MTQVETRHLNPRNGNGAFIRTEEQARKDHEAAAMQSKSMTLKQIGEHFGVTFQAAALMIQRAIADIPRGSTIELVAVELDKLDSIERECLAIMQRPHPVVAASGRIVTRVVEIGGKLQGVELVDDSITLAAMDRLLKVSTQRARLLGLNAPTNVRLEVVNYDTDAIDAEFEEFKQRALDIGLGDSTGVLDEP